MYVVILWQIIRLKQVDHIKSEVVILSMLSHPFIVNMSVLLPIPLDDCVVHRIMLMV